MGQRSRRARRCDRCRMLVDRCICAHIPRIATDARLCLVMHRRELRKTTATGPLALAALANSELHVQGVPQQPLDLRHLGQEGRRVVVLFPSEEARLLDRAFVDEDRRPTTLVVPDGNWSQATRVPKRIPGLIGAETVALPPGPPTRWGIRRPTRTDGLATFEAIARAFGILASPREQEQLEALFDLMVATTFAARGYDKQGNPIRSSSARDGETPDVDPARNTA
ncbi:MAG: DTW domain-containing protein [Acidobacteria bacterium]|nr:DTW domain-containing protein [Acidobacteriota bacterium]